MSSSRRGKKGKIKIWFPILCVVVIGITFYMLNDLENKVDEMNSYNTALEQNVVENTSKEQVEDIENIVEDNQLAENVANNSVENTVQNEIVENTQKVEENNTTKNTVKNQVSTQVQAGVTDKKQKAIELVKKEWGEDDTVSYVFDYINENGEYVIAVKDRLSATVKYYFRVNLETESVELD